ncbi:hypothetical protein MJD09_08940 [bacterium]|nr:hypothetical protein [bacterium]
MGLLPGSKSQNDNQEKARAFFAHKRPKAVVWGQARANDTKMWITYRPYLRGKDDPAPADSLDHIFLSGAMDPVVNDWKKFLRLYSNVISFQEDNVFAYLKEGVSDVKKEAQRIDDALKKMAKIEKKVLAEPVDSEVKNYYNAVLGMLNYHRFQVAPDDRMTFLNRANTHLKEIPDDEMTDSMRLLLSEMSGHTEKR